jgi:hypothetical protein
MRGPGSGGASTINGCRPKLGPNASRKARKFGSARAALLPVRSGLLAHREGRNLDRHLGNLGQCVRGHAWTAYGRKRCRRS